MQELQGVQQGTTNLQGFTAAEIAQDLEIDKYYIIKRSMKVLAFECISCLILGSIVFFVHNVWKKFLDIYLALEQAEQIKNLIKASQEYKLLE